MDILETPTYCPAMAGRLTGLRPERVRRWLHGYKFAYPTGTLGKKVTGRSSSVIRSETGSSRHRRYASFLELIDLMFVKHFVEIGIPLQKLRKALNEAGAVLGERHFANQRFLSDGREIYLRLESKQNPDAGCLLQLLSNGQWVIPEVIEQTAQQIDFDDTSDYAIRWFPPSGNKQIVLDPKVSFGAPTIFKRGIKTANIYDLFLAENNSVAAVSEWMAIDRTEVQSAVEFEMKLAA